ncbi:MAG: zinc-dependent peptidase, partial [Puniceicoccales bacterium]|nr:zinc-dependent peptidase [Puniceicoccales bacterium]
MFSYYVIGAAILISIGIAGWLLRRYLLRKKAWRTYNDAPFPPAWIRILRLRVPLYSRLPSSLRERFHRHVKVFLSQKTFTPCGGFKSVNDTMAVAIAGHACIMLCGSDG